LEKRDNFEDLGVDGSTLKLILDKQTGQHTVPTQEPYSTKLLMKIISPCILILVLPVVTTVAVMPSP